MNIHPTDTELQDYALQPPGAEHAHIDGCPQCMELVQQYRQLFNILSEPIPEPPFHVADAVMAKLPRKRPSATVFAIQWTVAGILLIVAISIPLFLGTPGLFNRVVLMEGAAMALLVIGAVVLGLFLSAIQINGYRKIMRQIKSSQTLQPDQG